MSKKEDTSRRGIYRFYWDCGRQGDLHGILSATEDEIDFIVGKNIHFGEVLGKHSEVFGKVEAEDLKLVSDNPVDVEVFDRLSLSNGFNPFDYYDSDQELEDDE
jgi:hypothetical protein